MRRPESIFNGWGKSFQTWMRSCGHKCGWSTTKKLPLRNWHQTVIYVTHRDRTEAIGNGKVSLWKTIRLLQRADTWNGLPPSDKQIYWAVSSKLRSVNFMETIRWRRKRNGAVYLEADGGVTFSTRRERNGQASSRLSRKNGDLRSETGGFTGLKQPLPHIGSVTKRISWRHCWPAGDDRCRSVSAYEYRKKSDYSKSAFRGAVTVKESLHCMQIWRKHRSLIRFTEENILSLPVEKKNVQQHRRSKRNWKK